VTVLYALISGVLFGCGLLLSGMVQPANVIAFLDVTGDWSASLAYTMAAAVLTAAPAYAIVRSRGSSLRGDPVAATDRWRVDRWLLGGSAVFGIGWGLSGICPGPALILLTSGQPGALAFAGAMVTGMWLAGRLRRVPSPTNRSDVRIGGTPSSGDG